MSHDVNIFDLITTDFDEVLYDIVEEKYTHFWFKGGRGSCKSSFCSLMTITQIMSDDKAHAAIFRKYGNTLRSSVYNQMIWALEMLDLLPFFTCTVSPMEITRKETGQKIIFRGLDDPTKSKSQKMPFGYFKVLWFEELEQYHGMDEIRKVTQSYMRGGSGFTYFYTYNPPQNLTNWVNSEAEIDVPNRIIHTSNYLHAPQEWLGEEFFIEADLLSKTNPRAYRHEYLGEITGTGGIIFPNVVKRPITDSEIKSFCNPRKGIDWGYAVDPFAYVAIEYDKTRRIIYIYDEIYKTGMLNDEAIKLILAKKIGRERIVADSAEPKSITEFRRSLINIVGAKKGKDSVQYGIKWLQQLTEIVIDPDRCPNAYLEFSRYEFEKDRNGEFKSEYPDKNNHILDSTRYALESDCGKGGLF